MHRNRELYAGLGYEELTEATIEGREAVWMRKVLG